MVVADLHVHTTRSDGTLPFRAVPAAARAAGLEAVALTDHDRLQPGLDGPVVTRGGVTLVHGIELRVEAADQRLDLLGYGVGPTEALAAECARIQRDRERRGRAIIACVEDRLGTTIPVEARPGLGRPHVARAISEVTDLGVEDAFDRLIGAGEPCFVAREVPSFDRGRRLLEEACALVGLAHPLRYPDPDSALERCRALGAVERWYPYDGDPDPAPVERAIDAYDLVPTGGSDAHGERLGTTGLDRAAYSRVERQLGV